jgi:ppGpp synthetase/RelA/SpoT-type nucleotidyltranferase
MEIDTDQIRKRYSELMPKYQNLAINLKQALELFLHNAGISYLSIDHRVKDIDSFIDKISRKKYTNPFDQVEDICGLRIVCYYTSDLEKICDIIKKEFNIIESADKEHVLRPDQFGYRSYHFIVKTKGSWLNAPNYRGLENLTAEIQVRTVLMHAWAEIEHKLAYKKKIDIPDQFQRKFAMIAAKLEETDQQFEQLRVDSEEYRKYLITNADKADGVFDSTLPLNLDNLQAFLGYYFRNQKTAGMQATRSLLEELIMWGITMKQLVESYQKVKPFLPQIEEEDFGGEKLGRSMYQQGMARLILDLTDDGYFTRHDTTRHLDQSQHKPLPHVEIARKWRKRIREE